MRQPSAVLVAAAPSAALAAESSGSLVTAALQTFTGLALVLVAIVAVAFVAKRLAPGRLGRGSLLKTVAALPVGTRERVIVVEMGDQWLVLGVTPTSINTLHVAPRGELPAAPSDSPQPMFAQWLERAKGETRETRDPK